MSLQVIITDCDHENINIEKAIFDDSQISFALKTCITEQDVIDNCQEAAVFLNQYAPITRRVMENLPELKMVIRYGVGVNNVDVEAATDLGIQVCNVPDYGMHEVADHALALMLALTRKVSLMNDQVKKGNWDYQYAIPIFRHSQQVVGIIGLGRIGTAFAHKVHGLGCRVIAYDPKKTNLENKYVPEFVEMVDLEMLLTQSDVISIHCPLETARNLIDKEALEKMKSTAYLINVSRGGIINEDDLDHCLKAKKIAGAALDVAAKEPLGKDSPLLQHDNLLCTPHMAWYSEQSAVELKRKVAEEAVRFLTSEQVKYPINQL
ncbi:D-3-phosphoglycerate dehydrogenase [Planomicrobium soli]|uniref:D-3-phosphoglycerate dehydrogenase n=1 Tax=Planomicrobium soli TaxID=1176648 RepID=A0A2P8H1T8_9BACL|nr:C-terminal binding protein [Planomicrobium soli]PSL40178.1 D-3-phosphoglycerate dehydrogenase [Planomicrobium soli]